MSDTPRTDQYVKMRASLAYCVEKDTADFARQLERELASSNTVSATLLATLLTTKCRELAEAREELDETRKDYNCLAERLNGHDATECRANLDRLIKERDMLLEGLEKLASCDWVITLPDRMDAVRNIANETLNKLKQ